MSELDSYLRPYLLLGVLITDVIIAYWVLCSDLFAGSGYASAYYVYLWAEVLDAGRYTVSLLGVAAAYSLLL